MSCKVFDRVAAGPTASSVFLFLIRDSAHTKFGLAVSEGVADKKYFFYCNEDGNIVNCDHPYYHQIQAQLHLTNRDRGYFFIWTPIDTETLILEKDNEWAENLDILKDFYLNVSLKHVFTQ